MVVSVALVTRSAPGLSLSSLGKWFLIDMSDTDVPRASLTRGAPGFVCDLRVGPKSAIGPSARLRDIDALVTRSALG